jgi:hypothetical protein
MIAKEIEFKYGASIQSMGYRWVLPAALLLLARWAPARVGAGMCVAGERAAGGFVASSVHLCHAQLL